MVAAERGRTECISALLESEHVSINATDEVMQFPQHTMSNIRCFLIFRMGLLSSVWVYSVDESCQEWAYHVCDRSAGSQRRR